MSRSIRKLARRYRIDKPSKFRLKNADPADTAGLDGKDEAEELRTRGVAMLREQQEKLYAHDKWAVLLIFQAMDAAGKDGTIAHVMSGVDPQGCEVHAFKAPSPEELDHDFLWRTNSRLPPRGRIGIFNRSYYEEVLIAQVHPAILAKQKLPQECVTKKIWGERYEDINAMERHLTRNGTVIRKFFLNVSREEQKRRFLSRLDEPSKNWKFALADVDERHFWDDYMNAYEDMIRATSTEDAPWYVVPADNKWFTRGVVAAVVVETLASLNLAFPEVSAAQREGLRRARGALMAEGRFGGRAKRK
jgi:PPK2 family polyphosphate:nucleotide phosphotransferase